MAQQLEPALGVYAAPMVTISNSCAWCLDGASHAHPTVCPMRVEGVGAEVVTLPTLWFRGGRATRSSSKFG